MKTKAAFIALALIALPALAHAESTKAARAEALIRGLLHPVASPTCFSFDITRMEVPNEKVPAALEKLSREFWSTSTALEFKNEENAARAALEDWAIHYQRTQNSFTEQVLFENYLSKKDEDASARKELSRLLREAGGPALQTGYYDESSEVIGDDLFVLAFNDSYKDKTSTLLVINSRYCMD